MEYNKYEMSQQGIYIEYLTNRDDLNNLIKRLHPIKSHFELQRFGGDNDGGYLLPNDLQDIAVCFSPGVDVIASFEMDLLNRMGIDSHLVDYSVDAPPVGFIPKSFIKKYLGTVNDEKYITLDSWVRTSKEFQSNSDFLLQMDIEGGEYTSILGVTEEVLSRFRIMVIEIHNIESWGQPDFFNMVVNPFFNKLLKHFYVLHNHPNNCCGIVNIGGVLAPRVFELTLIRKDRCNPVGFANLFPHPLDRQNVLCNADITLPDNWFSSGPELAQGSIDSFLKDITGVIHIGANVGQERDLYEIFNLDVIWIEPIPEIFAQLKANTVNYHKQSSFNLLLTDLDNQEYDFKISNNGGESSSIFDIALHKEIWPNVEYTRSIKIKSHTFSSFVKINQIDLMRYQALVLDTQGSELLILKGCEEHLKQFKYIKTEAPNFESYAGCCQLEELSSFLFEFGFIELKKELFAQSDNVGSYYDVLYVRS